MLNLCKIKEEEKTYTESGRSQARNVVHTRCSGANEQPNEQARKMSNQPPQNMEANSKTTDMLANTALGSNYEMRLGDGSQLYNLTRISL